MTHTLQAIAWTLIHFCWQATAIAAAYRVASLAIARRSSNSRYLVALCALLLMVAVSITTFAWEFRSTMTAPVFASANANIQTALSGGDFPRTTAPGYAGTQVAPENISLASVLPWIDGIWLLGVLGLSLRSLGGWWLIQRLRTSATAQAPAAVLASFQRIAAAMGLRRPVLLRVSSAIAGPVTVGALRAIVLLPLTAATSLSPEELEVVFAHELAHVRRADFFWNLMQTLAETLFFFHPAVWWISAHIRHERELCCDDLALQICPNPFVYAHALFRLEEQRSRQWRLAMALDGHQSPQTLRMRVARILGEPATRSGIRQIRPLSLGAACASLVVLLLPVPQLLASLNPQPQPASKAVIVVNPGSLRIETRYSAASLSKSVVAPSLHGIAHAAVAMPLVDVSAEPAAQAKSDDSAQPKSTYIDRMKAAGYDVDLDKYIAMKIQDVTPEYARAMAEVGFGKPSADDLIACKIHGVSPEAIAKFKAQGLDVKSLQDAISFRIFEVTPEFVAGMKAAGFDNLTSKQLLEMRVQGVTPEYARDIKRQFPSANAEDLVKTRIFNIDAEFIASANKHGFSNLSLEKLVKLRISGILDDESVTK